MQSLSETAQRRSQLLVGPPDCLLRDNLIRKSGLLTQVVISVYITAEVTVANIPGTKFVLWLTMLPNLIRNLKPEKLSWVNVISGREKYLKQTSSFINVLHKLPSDHPGYLIEFQILPSPSSVQFCEIMGSQLISSDWLSMY